jgi:hypothetical protein
MHEITILTIIMHCYEHGPMRWGEKLYWNSLKESDERNMVQRERESDFGEDHDFIISWLHSQKHVGPIFRTEE